MTEPTLDEATLRQWIGREEVRTDIIAAGPPTRMAATLDKPRDFVEGDALPALWHWFYFLGAEPLGGLARDGLGGRGAFMPPVALPRRMSAGSRFDFHSPIEIGMQVVKTSRIANVAIKQGRSGTLCFVTVEHRYEAGGAALITEEFDLVFREDPNPDAPAPPVKPAPSPTPSQREIIPGSVLLFRYSALTFNSHRIHYDREYCRDVEGYPGLVVHGPLTGTLLAGLAEEKLGRLHSFSFAARSPLFDTEPFTIDATPAGQVWARTPDGMIAMEARATAQPAS